jgi:tetratricopeptide (TPR) repeat protein
VSKAAVSKWEKAQCYPDIMLLPQLAAYFNISIDELLHYSPQLARDEIRRLCLKLSDDFMSKPFNEVMKEYRETVKVYYSCFLLLHHLAVLLLNMSLTVTDEGNKAELMSEVRILCERVIAECGDPLLAADALEMKCFSLFFTKEPEEILDLMGESIRSIGISEAEIISGAYDLLGNTEKAMEVAQCGMYEYLLELVNIMTAYVGLAYEKSFEAARMAFERLLELIDLFDIDRLSMVVTTKVYLLGAEMYCMHGKHEEAYEMLDRYADACIETKFPLRFKGDAFFTDIDQWLEESTTGATVMFSENMIKQRMIDSINDLPSIAVLKEEARYQAILKRINDIANMSSVLKTSQ